MDNKTVKIQTDALIMAERVELYMLFKGVSDFAGYKAVIQVGEDITELPMVYFENKGTVYKQFASFSFSGLTAAKLREDVTITICDPNGNAVSSTYTYSVENKASTMLEGVDGPMVNAMMHYSDAAKVRFG